MIENGDFLSAKINHTGDAVKIITFYALGEIDENEDEYIDAEYFAIVQFNTNIERKYTYQIECVAMEDYNGFSNGLSGDEMFWKFVQPYKDVLDCSPYERCDNKYP